MEEEIGSERSHTRVSKACQRCRALKARCLPSTEDDGKCQRCLTFKRDCVWPEDQPRLKRRRGPSRIEQVEQKIDRLVARVSDDSELRGQPPSNGQVASGPNHPSSPPSSPALSADKPTVSGRQPTPSASQPCTTSTSSEDQSSQAWRNLATMHNLDVMASGKRAHAQPAAAGRDSPLDAHLVSGLLADPSAESLLEEFRSMMLSFPFVMLKPETTVAELRREKPVLLLAIMAVASWRDRPLQLKLEKQLRHELAQRTIVQPRKDLALLQSILLYLSWYHYFFANSAQSPGTVIHLAISLVTDLRLYPRPTMNTFPKQPVPAPRTRNARAEQRALLGCYFLCSIMGTEFMVPEMMQQSEYLAKCSQRLHDDHEYDSDRLLPYILRAREIDDQLANYISSEDAGGAQKLIDPIWSQFRLWKARSNEWKSQSQNRQYDLILNLTSYSLETKMANTALSAAMRKDRESVADAIAYRTNARDNLHSCLEAGRSFLDALVAAPLDSLHLLPFAQWMCLPRMVMTMMMMCIPNPSHPAYWDTEAAQDRVRLDLFLDALCFRMQNLTTFKPPEQMTPDYWMVLKLIMQSVRGWYMRKKTADPGSTHAQHLSASTARHLSLDAASGDVVDRRKSSAGELEAGHPTPQSTATQTSPSAATGFGGTPDSSGGGGGGGGSMVGQRRHAHPGPSFGASPVSSAGTGFPPGFPPNMSPPLPGMSPAMAMGLGHMGMGMGMESGMFGAGHGVGMMHMGMGMGMAVDFAGFDMTCLGGQEPGFLDMMGFPGMGADGSGGGGDNGFGNE